MSSINRSDLTRFAWLSILAALVTIGLKLDAFWLTNSVGLLSDAIESLVNLVTAIVALIALTIAARPANDEFSYGYSKVEFFSSGYEGSMILVAGSSTRFSAAWSAAFPVGNGILHTKSSSTWRTPCVVAFSLDKTDEAIHFYAG